MTIWDYMRDKILIILLNGLSLFLLCLYLLSLGNSLLTLGLIIFCWLSVLLLVLAVNYHQRKNYFSNIFNIQASLEKPYLIQEFMGDSWRLEDQLHQQILRNSNKAVIEKIQALEREQQEYREYIEGWIHEAKLPITAMRLTLHNQNVELRQKLEISLTEMDDLVEQALFYARSDQVYKDFTIKETDLQRVVLQAISKNKHVLIHQQMTVVPLSDACYVQTDEKWLIFILGQLLINAMKYKKAEPGKITFTLKETAKEIQLSVTDEGIGIPENELGRVFEKGFTGSNGRSREKTTGIGLYLCKKLCKKLDLGITITSQQNEFTTVTLIFSKNTYLSKL